MSEYCHEDDIFYSLGMPRNSTKSNFKFHFPIV